MKIISKTLFSAVFLLTVSILAGCSNNDLLDTGDDDSANAKGISFTLTEPDFGTEEAMGNCKVRRLTDATDTTDLGDGVLGETSITRDYGSAAMRVAARAAAPVAKPMSNGNYTVLAYDASGTLKGTIHGKVSAGKFSKNDKMTLPPGTYTFVCLNDKVDYSGGVISVSRANAATARIGRTVKAISGPKAEVPFVMYHAGVRVRVSLEAMVNIPRNVKAQIIDNSGNAPTVVNYDPMTGTYTTAAVGALSETADAFPPTGKSFDKEKYVSTPNPVIRSYHYLLPSQTTNIQLKFTSGDQIYYKNLVGRTLTTLRNSALNANGSYLLNAKLTKVFKYVFDDGTVGFLRDKGTRTPIALVISETDRSAISLHDANNGNPSIWTLKRSQYNNPVAERPSQLEQIPATSQGLHWTWDANGSVDGVTVKANEPVKCPAFYHAAHYDPGVNVTGSNLSKWYLGANTDWKNLYLYVGFGTNTHVNANSSIEGWYFHVLNKAFADAGGTTLSVAVTDPTQNVKAYWSATYYKDYNTGCFNIFKNNWTDGNHSLNEATKLYIRAFIHY